MKNCKDTDHASHNKGFSLVEMLASVAIIGVIAFLAIPSVSRMREDSERNLAIARAEALNVAMATLVQMRGRTQAQTEWAGATSDDAKYVKLQPYLSWDQTPRPIGIPLSTCSNPSGQNGRPIRRGKGSLREASR